MILARCAIYYAPALGALRDDARLTSVCRVHRVLVENLGRLKLAQKYPRHT